MNWNSAGRRSRRQVAGSSSQDGRFSIRWEDRLAEGGGLTGHPISQGDSITGPGPPEHSKTLSGGRRWQRIGPGSGGDWPKWQRRRQVLLPGRRELPPGGRPRRRSQAPFRRDAASAMRQEPRPESVRTGRMLGPTGSGVCGREADDPLENSALAPKPPARQACEGLDRLLGVRGVSRGTQHGSHSHAP